MKNSIKKGIVYLLILSSLFIKADSKNKEYSITSKKDTSISDTIEVKDIESKTEELPEEKKDTNSMHIYARYYKGTEQIKMNVPDNCMEMYRWLNRIEDGVEQVRLYASFDSLDEETLEKENLTYLDNVLFDYFFVQGSKDVTYNIEGSEETTKEGYVYVSDNSLDGDYVISPVYDMENDPLYVVENQSTKEIYVASKNDFNNNSNLILKGLATVDVVNEYNTGVYTPYITEAINNPEILQMCSEFYKDSNTQNKEYVPVLK